VWLAIACACTPVTKPEAPPGVDAPPAAGPVAPPPASAPDPFAAFLSEHGLTYAAPPGYRVAQVPASERWAHKHAIASTSMDLEIRLGVAPAAVDEQLRATCKDDPRCAAAPSKAALEGMLGAAVASLAAPGTTPKIQEFPLDAVRHEFNAHWGGAVGFDVDPAFAGHKQGLAIIIHREGRGTAMFVTLYPEASDQSEDERMRAFHALRFAEPFVAAKPEHAGLAGTRWTCGEEGFSFLRFEPTTLSRTTLSAPMLVMGRRVPYETEYAEVAYLPEGRVAATALRVDNMEQGDRTPRPPVEVVYTATRAGDKLSFTAPTWKEPWTCTLIPAR
jgi:hypothetical protein